MSVESDVVALNLWGISAAPSEDGSKIRVWRKGQGWVELNETDKELVRGKSPQDFPVRVTDRHGVPLSLASPIDNPVVYGEYDVEGGPLDLPSKEQREAKAL